MKNGVPVADEPVNYYYLGMIKKAKRIRAFQSAIRASVRPDNVVVEIGSGLGTYSFFAVQSSARRVYAIEPERVIEVAENIATKKDLSERITLIRGDSTEVVLPEQADVLVFEDFSSLFLRRGLEELVRDALDGHLKDGGIVLPHAVSLHLAPVGDRSLWNDVLKLEDERYQLYGLDMSVLREMMLASPHVRKIEPEALLADPQVFKTIVLKQQDSYLFDEVLSARISRSGVMYGLVGWFDLMLTNDVRLSNAPTSHESVWRPGVLPLANPLHVTEGELVTLGLSCARSSQMRDLWWTWQGSATSGFAHNCSFQGIPFRPNDLDGHADKVA
jgi:precorrin-6B methylase 2